MRDQERNEEQERETNRDTGTLKETHEIASMSAFK
jgi:hypothetical protein